MLEGIREITRIVQKAADTNSGRTEKSTGQRSSEKHRQVNGNDSEAAILSYSVLLLLTNVF